MIGARGDCTRAGGSYVLRLGGKVSVICDRYKARGDRNHPPLVTMLALNLSDEGVSGLTYTHRVNMVRRRK